MSDSDWFPYSDRDILYASDGIVVDLVEDSHVNIMLYTRSHPNMPNTGDYAMPEPNLGGSVWASLGSELSSNPNDLDDLITVLQYAKLKLTERKET